MTWMECKIVQMYKVVKNLKSMCKMCNVVEYVQNCANRNEKEKPWIEESSSLAPRRESRAYDGRSVH